MDRRLFGMLIVVALLSLTCQLNRLVPTPTPSPSPTATLTLTPIPPEPIVVPTVAPVPPTAQPVAVTATTTENLRIRAAPSTSAQIVGQLKKGDTVQVLGRTAAADWWQIQMPSNSSARGWISASFADLSASSDVVPVVPANGEAPTATPPAQGAYPGPAEPPSGEPYPGPANPPPQGAYPYP
ncbi:MAG: SH3 domain-containing protein [Chloroflexi bacterium]|nr:SH3 domain-containing protein [Chloroflexota bacterium]